MLYSAPYINIHTHNAPVTTTNEVAIFNVHQPLLPTAKKMPTHFSVGLHPNFELSEEIWHTLQTFIQHKNCIAIGEIGLDTRSPHPAKLQHDYLLKQLTLAHTLQKPVIIHCVRAHQELLALKKQYFSQDTWVLHGFRGKLPLAEQWLAANAYLSFGVALQFDTNTQAVFTQLPTENIFLETDANEVAIESIYEKAAALKNCALPTLTMQLYSNFVRIFKPTEH